MAEDAGTPGGSGRLLHRPVRRLERPEPRSAGTKRRLANPAPASGNSKPSGMCDALQNLDLEGVWREHGPHRRTA